MFSPRWRKVLRDLWSNKSRTLLVVLSIAVGVFAIGMISGARAVLSRDLPRAYAAVNPADAKLFSTPFNESLIETIEHMKDVEVAEGRRQAVVRLKVGETEWREIQLRAIDDYENLKVDIIKPESGDWPPPLHEMLIERASIDMTNAQEGDTVLIETVDGKQRTMRVAGLVHDFNQPPAALLGIPFGYITFETLEWLGQPRNFNQLNIRVPDEKRNLEDITAITNEVVDKMERGGFTVFNIVVPEPGKHPMDTALEPLLLILQGVGFLALGLSGFLVINIISALLSQQMRQIGVMKAIGARQDQLMGMYYGSVAAFGLLSLFIAIPLGIVGAYLFTSVIATFLNFDLKNFTIAPDVIATQVAVGLLVPMIAATWPVLSGTRVTVREAMSSYGLSSGSGTGFTDRLIRKIKGLPRPLLLSLRNTFRRQGRLILTLITLTMASAIFVTVFTIRESLLMTLDDALAFWNYDVAVIFNRAYRIDALEQEAMAIPGIVAAESWGTTNVRLLRQDGTETDNIPMYGIYPDTKLLQPTLLEGRWLLPNDQNAIVVNTDLLLDEPNISVGDEIIVKVEGQERTWQVVGIVRGVLSGSIFFTNYDYFARLTGEVGRGGWMLATTVDHSSEFQNQIALALEDRFKAQGFQINQTFTVSRIRGIIEFFFNIIVVFMAIMAVLIGVVGGLGLMGTMSVNVIERTREIGVMRAIGASNGSILQIFITEGVFIGMISWFLGTLIALPLSKVIADAVGELLFRAPMSYIFSVNGAILWLVLVILMAALASFLPARSAARLSVREVLAYE